jgi:aldose 1-epimerase
MLELKAGDLRAVFTPFGARLVSFFIGDVDVVAGGAGEAQFRAGEIYAGATCGRYAGRITNATYALDGKIVRLAPNMEGKHQLHGGPDNFAMRNWESEPKGNAVRFSIISPDGDQGFLGELRASATYGLEPTMLWLDLEATTTKPTVVNLTNHAYWNLAGHGPGLTQAAEIPAHSYLPLDNLKLPTGEIRKVDGSRWDFRKSRPVAEAYDHAWVLDGKRGEMKRAITLADPASGRRMEIHCTECCLQFYTADHWNPSFPGKYGPLEQYSSIALEPQNFPDAPTHPNFPSAVLRPGESYRHRIEWRFV